MTSDLVRGRTTLGDFELTILTDGPYLLDGGAMFGVVPKTLWEKRRRPMSETRFCWAPTPWWSAPANIQW